MEEQHTLTHNQAETHYQMAVEDDMAIVEYTLDGPVITLTHTFVPAKLKGRGIGSQIVRAVLEDVRQKGLQVVPQCEFVAQYIFRHPEYEDLVLREIPPR